MSNAFIIDGKAFAAQLRQRVAAAVESFIASTARKPGLAVVGRQSIEKSLIAICAVDLAHRKILSSVSFRGTCPPLASAALPVHVCADPAQIGE